MCGMACSILKGYQRYDIKGTALTPNPASWHSLADVCQDFAKCLNSTGGCGKRVLIHVFLPGTRISLDIGDVKAAGVLCVLGISFGIGTYVLYKIYDRYIKPVFRRKGSVSSDEEETDEEVEDTCVEAGEKIMGNEQSTFADIPVYYRPGCGVSLYKPVEKQKLHILSSDGYSLRNRKIGPNQEELTFSNVDDLKATHDNSTSEVSGIPHSNHALDFRDLRLEIDESGFIEDENDFDGNPPSLSNSLKGNFSPRSLYEKSRHYDSLTAGLCSDEEGTGVSVKRKKNEVRKKNGDKSNFVFENLDHNGNGEVTKVDKIRNSAHVNRPDHDSLTPNGNLESSSVLLTPPPEDELSSISQPFPASAHSTKSDISDIHSEVFDAVSTNVNEQIHQHDLIDGSALTDDDQENFSPLPFDLSSDKSSDANLHIKALISKLNELKSRSRCNSDSSPSKSSCLEHRRVSSLGGSQDTFSGVSSPELELLKSETKSSVVTSGAFDNLECEIHEVEDEFMTLNSQLQELNDRYTNCDTCTKTGLDIIDGIYRRYPSIRVRHKNREIQNTHVSQFSHLSDLDTTRDSDMEMEADGADLSWDLDNVLDMLYSETSDSGSMQNPLVKKLYASQLERSEVGSPMEYVEENSFSSSVDLDGSLYEDEFHLQLGSARLQQSSSQSPSETMVTGETISHEEGEITGQEEEPSRLVPEAVCNIGTKLSLIDYAEREWRGNTPRAELMKNAYREVLKFCQYCHLRQIRGDNYCAIRGAVFQCLINNLPLFNSLSSKDCILQKLSQAFRDPSSGLKHWTFANRLPFTSKTSLDVMRSCLDSLYTKFEELRSYTLYSDREEKIIDLLNSSAQSDLELMEGVKLLMLLNTIDLHKDLSQGNDVPVFAWLMFARDTSETVEQFVKNHLNPVGESGGLEQVEMFLLGYSLGVRIQVFRLSQFGESDFVSYYPDDCKEDCQTVSLIAEDDRHYNVPVL